MFETIILYFYIFTGVLRACSLNSLATIAVITVAQSNHKRSYSLINRKKTKVKFNSFKIIKFISNVLVDFM